MDCTSLKLTIAVAAFVAVAGSGAVRADSSGGNSAQVAQNFQYTPYNGQNNTPDQAPPQDAYTSSHQGAPAPYNADSGSGDAYQAPPRQSGDANTNDSGARAGNSSGDAYSPPRSAPDSRDAYSPPQGDVYSPPRSQGYDSAPQQGDAYSPPRDGAGLPRAQMGGDGPPVRGPDGGMPRVEVQAEAPNDGLPYSVREHDARRAAIDGWRGKVTNQFGPEFAGWRNAADKHVDCHPDHRDGIVCTASAQPVRGLDRYGQAPGDDDRE